ncbi:MAG: type II secretion system minor pseudopilin GspK [Sphingopyxis sp.]
MPATPPPITPHTAPAAPHAPRGGEGGAALLTVLLLVALMAVVSATAVQRLTLSTRVAASAAAIQQAQFYQLAVETALVRQLSNTADAPRAALARGGTQAGRMALPGGAWVDYQLDDGGNCFNINSLVAPPGAANPSGENLATQAQFRALLTAIGVTPAAVEPIVSGATDWIDADSNPRANGRESATGPGGGAPIIAPNRPVTDASEIMAMGAITPPDWAKMLPWLCALPTHAPSPININTLRPEQAPLLQMLTAQPGLGATDATAILPIGQARAAIAARPAGGYRTAATIWAAPAMAGYAPPAQAADQLVVAPQWIKLQSDIRVGDVTLSADALIDVNAIGARVVRRKWKPNA